MTSDMAAERDALALQVGRLLDENKRLRKLYENVTGNRERFGFTINHLLECEEALRVAQEEVDVAVAEGDARYSAFIEGLTAKLNAAGVPAMPSWPDAIDWLIKRAEAAAERDALAARVEELEARIARALTALDAPVPSSASSYARRILRGEDTP